MIPARIIDAAAEHGWSTRTVGNLRFTVERGDRAVYGIRDLSRHTTARAYRGNALSAILRSQREIVAYMKEHGA